MRLPRKKRANREQCSAHNPEEKILRSHEKLSEEENQAEREYILKEGMANYVKCC